MELVRKWEKCTMCNGSGKVDAVTKKPSDNAKVQLVKCPKCKGVGKKRCDKFATHRILRIKDNLLFCEKNRIWCPVDKQNDVQCHINCAGFGFRQSESGDCDYAICVVMGSSIIGELLFTDEGNDESN